MKKIITETSQGKLRSTFMTQCSQLMEDGAYQLYHPDHFEKNMVCAILDCRAVDQPSIFHICDPEEFHTVLADKRAKIWFIWNKVSHFSRELSPRIKIF